MTKKRISKLFIFILCAVFALPLSILSFEVKASNSNVIAYVGTEFSFTVSDEVKSLGNEVIITAKESADAEATVLFDVTKKDNLDKYSVTSYNSGVFKGRIKQAGDYTFTVAGKGESASKTFTKQVKAYSDINDTAFNSPSYSYSDTQLSAYKQKVLDATFVDPSAQDKVYISLSETYKVPAIESLIDTGFLSYSQYKRTVHYAAPGSSNYATSTAQGSSSKLSISLSKIGTYRYYVTLTSDVIDGRTFSITTKGLKEYHDGFYAVQTNEATPQRLYFDGTNYYLTEDYESGSRYTLDESKTEEEQILKVSSTPIIPIFEFEIGNAGPSISIASNPEKGYIDLEFTVGKVTISGNETTSEYELQYSQTGEDNSFSKAEEEYNESDGKFIPTKKGFYRVKVSVVDADGLTATKYSKIINVTDKYQTVKYVTSFGDWIKVNYVPFVFLCISGLCLVGIILLLVIKPKQTETAEEDGIDE